ncbi:MAG: beta-lactamase family protein, partial [Anaerolineae bacterium]|nr:beta-lactamase family protein [Anaerolineae bacterium]
MQIMVMTVKQGLERATPESQGIASAAILQFVEAVERQVHEFHSFMLLRHGKVVAEGWWSPYGPDIRHMLFSLSKSFTSTAIGLAVAEGHFSVNDPVISFFPDELPAQVSDNLKAMQVRHLLSMSTGHDVDTMPPMIQNGDRIWTKTFLSVPVAHPPGTHFLYNTGATYMLSAIVQKTTGMMLLDYLRPRLLDPLGIEDAVWEVSPQGIHMGGFGLSVNTEAIARFGQLYLQKGQWEGRPIIAEAWVADATRTQVSNGDDPKSDWTQGYGYQFWRCKHNNYRGDGAFGQYCIVMPEHDAVLAITAGLPDMQQPLNLVWDILLPAMGAKSLPDDRTAQDQLAQKLASLSIAPVYGKASSAQPGKISGKTYKVDANELGVETIHVSFTDSGNTITVKSGRGEEAIPCGYQLWQQSKLILFNDPWETEPAPITSSGAWTADDTFT